MTAEAISKTNNVYKIVNISQLVVSPFNARRQDEESKDSEMFKWLCESIKTEGLLEPLVVRTSPTGGVIYEIIAGTRRFAALKHIRAQRVEVVVKEMDNTDVRIASLIENLHRMDLTEDEKEFNLRQIYLEAWEKWKPDDSKLPHLDRRDYSTADNKLKLAKSYLQRVHNEATGTAITPNLSKVKGSKHMNDTTFKQEYFPTDTFKDLSKRLSYAPSTQINILRGYGSIRIRYDYVAELPPTYKEIVQAEAKQKALKEAEKQELAKRILSTRKVVKREQKRPKTETERVQRTIKTFSRKVERQRLAEQERLKKIKERIQRERQLQKQTGAVEQKRRHKEEEPAIQINPVRARQDISALGHKLFKLLTSQELQTAQSNINEALVKNPLAEETMKQLTTFFAGYSDIAAQQMVVIPLCIALERYRGMLYEAVEAQRRKEEMSGQ